MNKYTEIEMDVCSKINETEHWHPEIEFVYVVEGMCRIAIEDQTYQVPKNEMLLINSGKKHKLDIGEDSLICILRFPYDLLSKYMKEDYIYFKCNSVMEKGSQYDRLRGIMHELLIAYLQKEKRVFEMFSKMYEILDELVCRFNLNLGERQVDSQIFQNQRLSKILTYIYANYDDMISLTEVAKKVYMSPSSLSRFFKKTTGESFVKYVRKVRLQKAAQDLIDTQLPISKIAINNGFSNPSAMNKDFKEMFGVTPTEFRDYHQEENQKESIIDDCKKLGSLLKPTIEKKEKAEKQECYHIDCREKKEYHVWEKSMISVGPINILNMANIRKQLLLLKEKIDLEYLYIWSPFSKQMMIYGEKERGKANFNKIDEVLDFCIDNQLKVFLDLGQRTNKAMASENKMLYCKEEGIIFHSQSEWEEILEEFLKHITKRYGHKIVEQWVFEFSFFLNERPYYEAERYSSKTVWRRGYQIVKKVIPKAKVAGPGLLVMPDEKLMRQIMEDFFSGEYQPDIFTSMNMPFAGAQDSGGYHKIMNEDFLKKEVDFINEILEDQKFAGQYVITNWSNSMANRNYVQDSCHRATFILKNVIENYQKVDGMGIYYASDLLNSYYDSDKILSGSAGLLTKDGICKPSLYAFEFLSQMGEYLVSKGEYYLITKNDRDDIQILVFNNKNLGCEYYMMNEDSYLPDKLESLFQNSDHLKLEISLEHMEKNECYTIRQRFLNTEFGSVLDKWVSMECTNDMSPEDVQYLKNVSVPEVSVKTEKNSMGTILLKLDLKPHEIRWISVVKQ